MTRKLSLTTAVAVAALGIGAPAAFGEGKLAGSLDETSVPSIYLDASERPGAVVQHGQTAVYPDWFERAATRAQLNQDALSTYRDAFERGVATEPQWLKALMARSEGLNKKYGLGEFATNSTVSNYQDAFERAVPPQGSVPVSATTSGTEIEWPQVGVGLGIGILLALGLGLIMRVVHIRPFAH